jgi:hypothetical protein
MKRCQVCTMPDTRPDTPFVDGVCAACINYARRPQIDWDARKKDLLALLDRHDGRCIVASSGGKDSHWQVLKLIELGATPLIVTATTCMLTSIGRQNIDNLGRYAPTIEFTPNRTVRAKLNKLGLLRVGDISWPEHVSIFTVPFVLAHELSIPLIFYGENPQDLYGGPKGSEEARTMTQRWRSEFGGFLGLRPGDAIGYDGITEAQMAPYTLGLHTDSSRAFHCTVEAHFLGAYLEWDSHRNAAAAIAAGMKTRLPTPANRWEHENLDNAMTGLHDHMMFRKYGYGRLCAQASIDIRAGRLDRTTAMREIKARDGFFPFQYMQVGYEAILDRLGMTKESLFKVMDGFTNWELFDRPLYREKQVLQLLD